MINFKYLIKYKISIFLSLLLLLLGRHVNAITMTYKESILGGGNIGRILVPHIANILINDRIASPHVLGGPSITPLGLGTLPVMNSPVASIAGIDLTGGINNRSLGPIGGKVMLPNIFPAMGQIPLSLSGMPVFTNLMILPGIMGLYSVSPKMVGPNPMCPLIMRVSPMCFLMVGHDPMCPLMMGFIPMNAMIMNGPINPFMMEPGPMNAITSGPYTPYPPTFFQSNRFTYTPSASQLDLEIQQSEDCISQTIFKTVKKGNITFLEVYDGCAGKIYHGYPAGGWLPAALTTPPQPLIDYRWWYGCSATCAGMMMAYYDKYPYYVDGIIYDLIPGGIAEDESFLNPDPWYSVNPFINELVKLCSRAIASKEHVLDFWTDPTDPIAAFGLTEDPLASPRAGDPIRFNCLADFMGTSQNNLSGNRGNPDGITWFWFSSDGSILSSDPVSWPGWYNFNYSGMYGLVEWAQYCQNLTGQNMNAYAYNQYIEGYIPPTSPVPTTGFSFYDYQREIDSGRPVIFLLVDWDLDDTHSVLGVGYGYNSVTGQEEVYIHDTWTLNNPADPKTIPWANGSYSYSVTVSETIYTFNFEIIGVTTFRPN